mmetsp:Transcript_1757/g.7853  ORF Transcript_1757/g.7853 Transcript_1757/m.7853 type:complete len:217 (-) Transcript_1757:229-879(-)
MPAAGLPLFSPLCAAATAVAKSCLLFTFLSDPSGAEYRTVNADVSGNFFCSAVMRSLCAIMVGTTKVRTSAPATALTVTGGPQERCCAWRRASASCLAARICAACFLRASSSASASAEPFLEALEGLSSDMPPRPATAFLGSKDSRSALAASLDESDAAAAWASTLAFFSWPVAWYARPRETSASTFFGEILSARVASATTSAQCRSMRWHWDFAA